MRSTFRITGIEIAIILVIAGIIAVRVWAPELRSAQNSALDFWGIPTWARLALGSVLATLFALRIYRRAKREAEGSRQPIVRWPVIAISLAALVAGVLIALALR